MSEEKTREGIKEYKTPFSIMALSVFGALAIGIGILLCLLYILKSSMKDPALLFGGLVLILSGVLMSIMYYVADDIHYIAHLTELQCVNGKTTVSYYDASIKMMAQQRDTLDEILENQKQLLAGKNNSAHD